MTRLARGFAFVSCLVLPPSLSTAVETRRLVLVAGANHGGQERVPLRYAILDADRFAAVMLRLGGVAPGDCVTLDDPTRQAFVAALADLRSRAARARQEGARVEVVLFYSGHADEVGLMLGHDVVSYREIRDAMQSMASDVGITVLDACASGVITRLKGGSTRPSFLTDDSMRMQGHAYLTSSSENEAAQESDRLQGSFFTHALVSGLRGAADADGDGRVTLGEAYQFAFQETLAETAATDGGAQHPAYDIRMAGTGDVVMTDVRQASAALVLAPDFDGRFFLRDDKRRLIAEMYKPAGRRAEVAVEPGTYEVQYEEGTRLYASKVSVAQGERAEIARQSLTPANRTATRSRGPASTEPEPFALAGRTRIEAAGGVGFSSTQGDFGNLRLGLVHWLREDVAIEGALALTVESGGSGTGFSPTSYTYTTTGDSFGLVFGARYYPPVGGRLRPLLRGTLGPIAERRTDHGPNGAGPEYSHGTVSGWLGGGLDWQLGPRFALTFPVGWEFRSEQKAAFGWAASLGFTFGQPRAK